MWQLPLLRLDIGKIFSGLVGSSEENMRKAIATANNISRLPAEMLRKGRFDEIFFTDLPTFNERKIIFKLHLDKRLKDSISEGFEVTEKLLDKLAKETEGFVGAEIEQVVISALFEAYAQDRELQEQDLFKVIKNTVPLSTTQSEQILAIREWANERAVSATAHDEQYNYVPEETEETTKKEQSTPPEPPVEVIEPEPEPEYTFPTIYTDTSVLKYALKNSGINSQVQGDNFEFSLDGFNASIYKSGGSNYEFKIVGKCDLEKIHGYFSKIETEYNKIVQYNIIENIRSRVAKSPTMQLEQEQVLEDNSVLLTIRI